MGAAIILLMYLPFLKYSASYKQLNDAITQLNENGKVEKLQNIYFSCFHKLFF
jgi:hypothetical protein